MTELKNKWIYIFSRRFNTIILETDRRNRQKNKDLGYLNRMLNKLGLIDTYINIAPNNSRTDNHIKCTSIIYWK